MSAAEIRQTFAGFMQSVVPANKPVFDYSRQDQKAREDIEVCRMERVERMMRQRGFKKESSR